jgi:Flp pilus assembly secretin CpaC
MRYSNDQGAAASRKTLLLGILLLVAVSLLLTASLAPAAPTGAIKSTNAVVLPEGRSTLLHFDRMKRVEVIEPDLVEVVVASLNELSVYGKKAGETTIYVWDKVGIHQFEVTVCGNTPADQLIQDLRRVLGENLKYTAAGDKAVVVEGKLSAKEADRARSVIAAAAKGEVQIVDLIEGEGDTTAGATALVDALRKVLGDKLQYVIWNNNTLLVQGTVGDQAEADRARKLLAAAGGHGINIVDLIETNEAAGQAPVEQIAKALGDKYTVRPLQGRTVAVEGTATSAAEMADLAKILDTFSGQAKIVNLVRLVEPRMDINQCVIGLQALVGNRCMIRAMDGQSIVVEGVAGTKEELDALRELISKLPMPYQLVDLLHIGKPDKRQIVCHVRVVDINKGNLHRLGVNWGQLSIKDDTVQFIDQPWLIHALPSGLGSGPGGILNALSVGAQLDLLAQQNQARILSEPNLMVDDGGQASILVGGEIPVPIAQPSGTGTSVTIEWKPYGVQLDVEPTILEDGKRIALKIAPEVSSLDFGNAITVGGFTLPALRSRKTSTELTMTAGDTLIIGGLLQSEDTKQLRKIPLLGDLPIIGKLFQRKEFQKGESELVITVTPEIIDRVGANSQQQFK